MTARAFSQAADARLDRQLEQYRRATSVRAEEGVPLHETAYIDYGGYLTPSYFSIDGPDGNNHGLRQYDLLGYFRVNPDPGNEFFFLGRLSYLDFNAGDSFDGNGDDHEERIERLYYHFDLARFQDARGKAVPDTNLSFTAGRQLEFWGNGLTLSSVLDGLSVNVSKGPFSLELLASVTPSETIDIDPTRPQFDDDTHRGFYGAMLTTTLPGGHRPYAYFLAQRDYNKEDSSQVGTISTDFQYDSEYYGIGSRGPLSDRLLYGIELTAETGRAQSNSFQVTPGGLLPVPQTEEDILAFAGDLQLDYLFNDPRKTRLSAEGVFGTGDPDRLTTNGTFGGNRPGTADHAFNSFGLINTGLVFAAPVSNLIAARVGLSTFPVPGPGLLEHFQVGADAFLFAKMRSSAPIDEVTTDDHYLGWEPDLFINWQMTEDLNLAVRYGVFFPGSAIPDDSARQGFFISVSYAF